MIRFRLLSLYLMAAIFGAGIVLAGSHAKAQLGEVGLEGIQEIIDVVDEVANESDNSLPPLPPGTPLPLGNAPENTPGGTELITPQTAPVDLTRTVQPDELRSLFFTFWEHNAIKDARNARGLARPPTEAELAMLSDGGEELERIRPPPEEREIRLGGIVFTRQGDWTIWLNSKRITPQALPREIVELRVYKDYIELKWLDEYTRQIFPIRLRPHQRFNMDSRIFLPG
ncbi:MAG: hypothetical protein LRY36_01395 [Alphaproteobacteria bacterium]|nr:hypothetical protein [Alphaproteobacteria bacterium]MCD8566572.1 hypothetical protein [Alphaproteobacteria bacterium]